MSRSRLTKQRLIPRCQMPKRGSLSFAGRSPHRSRPTMSNRTIFVWLLHLVGDVHQPLHATSGFSVSEQYGDSGGNDETINCGGCQETVLHWFWDDTPGLSDNPEDAITAAHALPPADPRQAAVRGTRKPVVYQPPVSVGPGPFALTDAYKAKAFQIAKQRVMLAVTRLAALLNTAVPTGNSKIWLTTCANRLMVGPISDLCRLICCDRPHRR
jgi:hypothetical protein